MEHDTVRVEVDANGDVVGQLKLDSNEARVTGERSVDDVPWIRGDATVSCCGRGTSGPSWACGFVRQLCCCACCCCC